MLWVTVNLGPVGVVGGVEVFVFVVYVEVDVLDDESPPQPNNARFAKTITANNPNFCHLIGHLFPDLSLFFLPCSVSMVRG